MITIKHLITKRLEDKSYIAFFRVERHEEEIDEIEVFFGSWIFKNKTKVKLYADRGSDSLMFNITSISPVLRTFPSAKIQVFGKTLKVQNSGIYEDLSDPRTFLNAAKKLTHKD